MTTSQRNFLRSIMQTAWEFHRAEPGRAFADCLRGAWKIITGLHRSGAALMKAKGAAEGLQLSPLLYRSPTVNANRGRPYGRWHAYKAARTTARVGW